MGRGVGLGTQARRWARAVVARSATGHPEVTGGRVQTSVSAPPLPAGSEGREGGGRRGRGGAPRGGRAGAERGVPRCARRGCCAPRTRSPTRGPGDRDPRRTPAAPGPRLGAGRGTQWAGARAPRGPGAGTSGAGGAGRPEDPPTPRPDRTEVSGHRRGGGRGAGQPGRRDLSEPLSEARAARLRAPPPPHSAPAPAAESRGAGA